MKQTFSMIWNLELRSPGPGPELCKTESGQKEFSSQHKEDCNSRRSVGVPCVRFGDQEIRRNTLKD